MDSLSVRRRSRNMRAIRSKDTAPELIVRRALTGLGYRYRLHVKNLPGKPDIVMHKKSRAIFVHGCFWHQHRRKNCLDSRLPKSNSSYWRPKLSRNVRRDAEHMAALRRDGWRVLVIWDCETKDDVKLAGRLRRFLGPT